MKQLRYIAEAVLLYAAFVVFKAMGPKAASETGGWIGRTIGPRLGASRKARANLQHAMPHLNDAERECIVRDMWDNLGRVIAEYPHLQAIVTNYVEVVGEEHIKSIDKDNPCVAIGAHCANWELFPFYFNYKLEWPAATIYREPNNSYVGALLSHARNPEKRGAYIAKSQSGTREMVKSIRDGGKVCILIDQKYNQGIPAKFFGHPAMTSTAFAQLSMKYDAPIIPLRVERVKGCSFRITLYAPLVTTGRAEEDIVDEAHGLLETWIKERPGQWLWIHRRWNSKTLTHQIP